MLILLVASVCTQGREVSGRPLEALGVIPQSCLSVDFDAGATRYPTRENGGATSTESQYHHAFDRKVRKTKTRSSANRREGVARTTYGKSGRVVS